MTRCQRAHFPLSYRHGYHSSSTSCQPFFLQSFEREVLRERAQERRSPTPVLASPQHRWFQAYRRQHPPEAETEAHSAHRHWWHHRHGPFCPDRTRLDQRRAGQSIHGLYDMVSASFWPATECFAPLPGFTVFPLLQLYWHETALSVSGYQ